MDVNIRHGAIKTFNSCKTDKAVVYFGVPLVVQFHGNLSASYFADVSDLGIDCAPLAELELPPDKDYVHTAQRMFKNVNPNTNKRDVNGSEFYASSIPVGVIGGIITPQIVNGNESMFNGEGTISVAEILDGINAIEYGANSNKHRRKSLDNVSNEDDFFNEGYNLLCSGYSSTFYNLYRRDELMHPITRIEFAYLLVVCAGMLGSLFKRQYCMGVSFDWLRPSKGLSKFSDWGNYRVSLVSDGGRPSFNIKDYKGSRTVTDYVTDMKGGVSAIPLPMLMSLAELGVNDLFFFEDDELRPLRQVTRGEFCYFVTGFANKRV